MITLNKRNREIVTIRILPLVNSPDLCRSVLMDYKKMSWKNVCPFFLELGGILGVFRALDFILITWNFSYVRMFGWRTRKVTFGSQSEVSLSVWSWPKLDSEEVKININKRLKTIYTEYFDFLLEFQVPFFYMSIHVWLWKVVNHFWVSFGWNSLMECYLSHDT